MTTDYTDYYWDSADASAFLSVLAVEPNIIGPVAGEATVAPGTDPARWYLAVRAGHTLATPDGCAETPPAVAQSLLGVWA